MRINSKWVLIDFKLVVTESIFHSLFVVADLFLIVLCSIKDSPLGYCLLGSKKAHAVRPVAHACNAYKSTTNF